MKRENFEEIKRIVGRIQEMEEAVAIYDKTHNNDFAWYKLFIHLFWSKNTTDLEIGYKHEYYITVSKEQQEELANLIRKWIEEDKKKLEKL